VWETFAGLHPQGPGVQQEKAPAVFLGQKAVLLRAGGSFAVAQVVVAHHSVPLPGQEAGEGIIPGYVLRHAVDQLDYRLGLAAGGQPLHSVDLVEAVGGGKCKLPQGYRGIRHGKSTPYVLK